MRVSAWTAATLVWTVAAVGACLLVVSPAIAQTTQPSSSSEPAAADKAGKEIHALRVSTNSAALRVDGRIDDEAWRGAQVISDLAQEDPDNMMPPTEMTTVRVASSGPGLSNWWEMTNAVPPTNSMTISEIVRTLLMTRTKPPIARDGSRA